MDMIPHLQTALVPLEKHMSNHLRMLQNEAYVQTTHVLCHMAGHLYGSLVVAFYFGVDFTVVHAYKKENFLV